MLSCFFKIAVPLAPRHDRSSELIFELGAIALMAVDFALLMDVVEMMIIVGSEGDENEDN